MDVFRRGLGLAVEDCGDGDFVAAELGGDVFEAHFLGCFCFEEGVGLDGEAVREGGLPCLLTLCDLPYGREGGGIACVKS